MKMKNGFINNKSNGFGTMPVFMTTVSTILGAILFLRFGWAIGNVGFIGVVGIVILGHLVTIPTAFAVAEIATNQKVQGGGAYYIISRSFGLKIGAAIGISLYLSQAISIAFYIIAFADSFDPIIQWLARYEWINSILGDNINDKRIISIPSMALLSILMLTRGAKSGMKFLYVVVLLLATAIIMFFVGKSPLPPQEVSLTDHIVNGENFFDVFTIIFPAFTGLAAGLGLSGDLRNPTRAIPRGTIIATFVGLVVYLAVAYKLTISASPDNLVSDYLFMRKIAVWEPIIPIGLAAATLSSALGSIMVAPRTLQALGLDSVFPNRFINRWLAKGKAGSNEPVNSSIISILIAFVFVALGELDLVAKIISMFFMVTYGAICAISVLEHFAADPSYRPTFKSRWYISLLGAILSFWLMFKMNWQIATLSVIIMALIYYMVNLSDKSERKGLVKLFRGVLFQMSRGLQILSQQSEKSEDDENWRPFVICISPDSFKRRAAFDLLRWISHKYGFGTYIHYIEGYLSKSSFAQSKEEFDKLVKLAKGSRSNFYLDTIVSPSYTSAIAQVIQLPGISGSGNNMILFEFSRSEPESFSEVLKNYSLLQITGFDVCVLNSSYKGFGYKNEIHIWITSQDYANANLMILLGYIILGHPDWQNGKIKIFAMYKSDELAEKTRKLVSIIQEGRLPISMSNLNIIEHDGKSEPRTEILKHSMDADLTIVGFRSELIKPKGIELFTGYGDHGNVLFVNSNRENEIKIENN